MQQYVTEVKTTIGFRRIYNMFMEAFGGDMVWSEHTFRRVLKNAVYISHDASMFEKGGIIIRKAHDEVEILNIAVHPKYQSQGIGKGLVQKAIAYYPDAHTIFLEVAIDNYRAIKLYEKIGFKTVGKREKYYEQSESGFIDALVMRYNIDPS